MIITVIIPVFNEYPNLLNLKQFFISTDLKDIEIIVADSKYTSDATPQIGYPFIYLQTGVAGRAAQMNKAVEIAKGEILMFLHADVIPPASFQDYILKTINAGADFGFFAYQFNPTGFMLNINANFTTRKGIFSGGGDQIHFMTRALFDQMKGYDEKFSIMEDFDFVRRYKNRKTPYVIIQDRAIVSARKYNNNSWLRVNLTNFAVFILFLCRTNPHIIKKIYQKLIR